MHRHKVAVLKFHGGVFKFTVELGVNLVLSHLHYEVCGVQFHPESVLTPLGAAMVANWTTGRSYATSGPDAPQNAQK
ncbi:MAG: hypothetical protein IPJ76_13935 [Flavobacteriales bacterium]|nr:MAG: hypothetical protein IPJ76_13935 [Flavobacteriales bacterium]